ncbi:MAG: HAMP domain-containing protein [Synergistales bacterium]|nr:HAMP domain-containing protein [Synergistales bacterium]
MMRLFHSVGTKFIVSIILSVVLFLGALMLVTYNSQKQAALENARELSAVILSQTLWRIDALFGEVRQLARSFAAYPAVREIRPEAMKPLVLAAVGARSNYLRAIYLGTTGGEMHEWGIGPGFVDHTANLEEGYDPRRRPWYRQAVERGRFTVSEPYLYASVPALGITGALPVHNSRGERIGVLGLDILLEDLRRMIGALAPHKESKVILLNSENRVIVNQFDGADGVETDKLARFTLFDAAGLEGNVRGRLMEPRGREGLYFVASTTHGLTGWKLLVAFPYNALMQPARETVRSIVMLEGVLTAILGIVLAMLGNTLITRPLGGILRVIRRIEEGDREARVPEDRGDEFGLLARQFNRLVDTIREYHEGLETKVKRRTEDLLRLRGENLRLRLIEEKEKIYGYLHDSLGARLTNINISNAVAQSALGRDGKTLREMLGRIETNTEGGIEDLKEILRGAEDGDRRIIDFEWVINANLRKRLELKEIALSCPAGVPEELNGLPRGVRFELEKILQELTSNVLKHSEATAVTLRVLFREGWVTVVFADNGRGGATESGGQGYGLTSIRHRVAYLGGAFDVDSPPGGGTTVRLAIPAAAA